MLVGNLVPCNFMKGHDVRIIRKPELRQKTGLSDVTIWRRVKDGKFPKPIQLSANSVGWYEHEIDAYLEALPRVISAAGAKAAA